MPTGYSLTTIKTIDDADQKLLGVRLAQLCVRLDIPVKDIAKYFGVSRVTVYNWFSGVSVVSDKHQNRMSELIKKLA